VKLFPFFSALLFATAAESAWSSGGLTKSQREETAPTGKPRVGVVSAPAQSAFFVVKVAGSEPRGVTVDLGKELARRLGVPVEFLVVSRDAPRGCSRRLRSDARCVAGVSGQTARVAHSRRELSANRHCDCRAEEPAERPRLCNRFYGRREGFRNGPTRV
jgi:hypothetical protein